VDGRACVWGVCAAAAAAPRAPGNPRRADPRPCRSLPTPLPTAARGAQVMCDACREWFHPACLGLSESSVRALPSFVCGPCLRAGHVPPPAAAAAPGPSGPGMGGGGGGALSNALGGGGG